MKVEVNTSTAPPQGSSSVAALQKQLESVVKQMRSLTKQLESTTDRDARQMLQQQLQELQKQAELIQQEMTRVQMPAEKQVPLASRPENAAKAISTSIYLGGNVDVQA